MKKGWILATVLLLVLVVAAAGVLSYLYMTKKISFIAGDTNEQVFATACSDDDRKQFFEEYGKMDRSSAKMKELYKKVTSSEDYKDDPNCLYVAYVYNTAITPNEVQAKEAWAKLKELNQKGINPDTKFTSIPDWTALEAGANYAPSDGEGSDGIG